MSGARERAGVTRITDFGLHGGGIPTSVTPATLA